MEATGNTKTVINPIVKAGEFLADTPEHYYWTLQHLERFREVADDNNQVLKIVAYYIPKINP